MKTKTLLEKTSLNIVLISSRETKKAPILCKSMPLKALHHHDHSSALIQMSLIFPSPLKLKIEKQVINS